MAMTTVKPCYQVEVVVKVPSINLDNLEIKFNSSTLYNEDEEDTIEISGRQYSIYKERCSEGVKVNLYIVNDGEDIRSRIDYLIDEEYYISSIDVEAKKISTEEILEVGLVSQYGEQTEHEISLDIDPKLEKSVSYLTDRLTEGNTALKGFIFNQLEEDETFQEIINQIVNIPVL